MYMDSSETTCFRDGISELVISSVRDGNNYIITPLFSYFSNNYIRDNLDTLFDFEWNVVLVNTPFNTTDRLNFRRMIDQ